MMLSSPLFLHRRLFFFEFLLVLGIFCCCFLPQVTVLASSAAGTETLVGIVGKDFILVGADSSVSQSISLTASNLDKIAALTEPFFYDSDRTPQPHHQQTIVAAAAGDAADSDRLVGLLQAHATITEYESGVGCDVDYVDSVVATTEAAAAAEAAAGLSVEGMAYLARGQIASALRSQTPYKVCLLIAGMMASTTDEETPIFGAQRVQEQLQGAWKPPTSGGKQLLAAAAAPSAEVAIEEDHTTTSSPGRPVLQPRLYWLDEYGSLQKIQYGAHGHGANFMLSILDQGYRPQMSREEATKLLRDCFQQLRTRYVINSPQPPCIKCVDANGVRLIR
jgi:20S proteasome subunit beta 4